ncbi:MAG: type II toxin-antitoxin system death-on-curing family toxin [Candidatus Paceibacterota bacterium]
MRTKRITVKEIEYVAFSFAQKLLTFNEPIPEFGTRFPNILESCIDTPFMQFDGKDLYRGLIGKSSVLFYFMIKNHPFQNGNKRIAVMTLLYLFHKNGKWLKMSNKDLYIFAKNIAKSKPIFREKIIMEIQETLKKHITDQKET